MLVIAASIATATFKLAFVGLLFALALVALLVQTGGRAWARHRRDGTLVVTLPGSSASTTPERHHRRRAPPRHDRPAREPLAPGRDAGAVVRLSQPRPRGNRPAAGGAAGDGRRPDVPSLPVASWLGVIGDRATSASAPDPAARRAGGAGAAGRDARACFRCCGSASRGRRNTRPAPSACRRANWRAAVSTVSLYLRPEDLYRSRNRHHRQQDQHDEARRRVGASGVGLVLRERPSGRTAPASGSACTAGRSRAAAAAARIPPVLPADGTAPRRCRARSRSARRMRHPLRRLILHNDLRSGRDRVRWHLVNPLAYDIAAARRRHRLADASGPVPAQRRVPGVSTFWRSTSTRATTSMPHRGHPVSLNDDEFKQLWRQVRAIRPLRMAPVGHLVDLDNLTRWFIATVFCATNDAYQGPGQFRDPTRESAQWFWVNWDMDQSFRQPEQDTFWYLLSRTGRPRGRRPNEPRPRIMVTLLDEDPEYRAYFQRVWTEVDEPRPDAGLPGRALRALSFAEASRLGIRDRAYLTPLKEFLAAASRGRLADRHRLAADRTRRHVPDRRDARRGRSSTASASRRAGRGTTFPACASRCRCRRNWHRRSRTGSSTASRSRARH